MYLWKSDILVDVPTDSTILVCARYKVHRLLTKNVLLESDILLGTSTSECCLLIFAPCGSFCFACIGIVLKKSGQKSDLGGD